MVAEYFLHSTVLSTCVVIEELSLTSLVAGSPVNSVWHPSKTISSGLILNQSLGEGEEREGETSFVA